MGDWSQTHTISRDGGRLVPDPHKQHNGDGMTGSSWSFVGSFELASCWLFSVGLLLVAFSWYSVGRFQMVFCWSLSACVILVPSSWSRVDPFKVVVSCFVIIIIKQPTGLGFKIQVYGPT